MTKHFNNCSAPLCAEIDCSNVVWCAGEEICSKAKGLLRQKQKRINNEFLKGRFQDSSWTEKELLNNSL